MKATEVSATIQVRMKKAWMDSVASMSDYKLEAPWVAPECRVESIGWGLSPGLLYLSINYRWI